MLKSLSHIEILNHSYDWGTSLDLQKIAQNLKYLTKLKQSHLQFETLKLEELLDFIDFLPQVENLLFWDFHLQILKGERDLSSLHKFKLSMFLLFLLIWSTSNVHYFCNLFSISPYLELFPFFFHLESLISLLLFVLSLQNSGSFFGTIERT